MIMKLSIIKYYCSFLVILLLAACKKDPDVTITDTQIGESKITYFVDMSLKGDEFVAIVKGQPFTDPGVTATEKGQPVDVKVSGSVNTAQMGIYPITYSAVNKDGFAKSIKRYVAVLPEAPDPSVDLSGTYASGTSPQATITKISDGLFYTTNCWGGGSVVVIPGLYICTDGKNVYLPDQTIGEHVVGDPGTYVNGVITMTVTRPDFPGGPLVRLKVWTKL